MIAPKHSASLPSVHIFARTMHFLHGANFYCITAEQLQACVAVALPVSSFGHGET